MIDGTPLFGDPVGPWLRVFAWRPVSTFDSGMVWLRPVWKRRVAVHYSLIGGVDNWWQYRRSAP